MKIEKVNDNQIRCTLTREDLDSRHLKLSELAYGTEKAKSLFREMMEKASYEFGFEAEDIPLMIEAVPLTADSILLIVTKVEYPDELDTRFSHFSEDMDEDDYDMDDYVDNMPHPPTAADDIISLFSKAKATAARVGKSADANLPNAEDIEVPVDIIKLFAFSSLDDLIRLSHVLGDFYHGRNTLYKSPSDDIFYLVISKSEHTPAEFNKACNILTEYGSQADFSVGQDAYFKEHYTLIIPDDALGMLAKL